MASFSGSIDHSHDRVVPLQVRELDYKIDVNSVPVFAWDQDQNQFSDPKSVLYLCLQAEVASGDIASDVARHVRPPIIPRDKFQGFEVSWVSCNFRVMAEGDDSSPKVGSGRNVNPMSEVE